MKLPLTGGCQCGAVRYEIAAEPLTVIACHCTECQKQSASAFGMTMPVPRPSFTITKGEPAHWERTADSGNIVGGAFCAACGVRLYHEPANKAFLNVKPGTLDDASWVSPVGHIWTDRAQPWLRDRLEGIVYRGQQPDMAALIAAWRNRAEG
ncbi:MAG: aldehyde-activating protein [Rhodospirillales bacterium]|nr:aldehyde-activating protein [Rhodospirillales bacterium]